MIAEAILKYLTERVPHLKDGSNIKANLRRMMPWYHGKTLDQAGEVARTYAREARREKKRRDPETGRMVDDPRPLSSSALFQRIKDFRSALNYARETHRMGTIEWCKEVRPPPARDERHVYLTRRQVVLAARAVKLPQIDKARARTAQKRVRNALATRALLLLVFYTGSRPGELYRGAPVESKAFDIVDSKTGDIIRKFVLPAMRRYMRHWPMPCDYSVLSKYWREARGAVGLGHAHLHDLRHSTASALISDGATLAEVGAVLDQKSVQTTKRYAHLYEGRKIELLHQLAKRRAGGRSGGGFSA